MLKNNNFQSLMWSSYLSLKIWMKQWSTCLYDWLISLKSEWIFTDKLINIGTDYY